MDPTIVVITALLSAASTEVVKRGIEGISESLWRLFQKGNKEEIKTFIERENLIEPISALAQQTIETSYILPFKSPKEARATHKVELISAVIRYGFRLSEQLNCDILLPGSLLGSSSVSVFSTNGLNAPTIKLEGKFATLGEYADRQFYSIFKMNDRDPTEYCANFKSVLAKNRLETDDYLSALPLRPRGNKEYSVERISAGSVYFHMGHIISMYDKSIKLDGNRVEMQEDWLDGVRASLAFSKTLPDIQVLSQEEGLRLMSLASELSSFYLDQNPSD